MGADALVPRDRPLAMEGGTHSCTHAAVSHPPSCLFPSAFRMTTLAPLRRAVRCERLCCCSAQREELCKSGEAALCPGLEPSFSTPQPVWSLPLLHPLGQPLLSRGALGSGQACRGPWLGVACSGGKPALYCYPGVGTHLLMPVVTLPATCPVAAKGLVKSRAHFLLSKDGSKDLRQTVNFIVCSTDVSYRQGASYT